jgi:biotin synthase
MDLLFRAQQVHREHFDANEVQLSTLLSIKTGGCPEDCGYCPQSRPLRHRRRSQQADAAAEVVEAARPRRPGATRFCMGAAWRSPKDRDIERVSEMVRRGQGARAGDLRDARACSSRAGRALDDAGLDYYNHNLDSAPEFYGQIITPAPTRTASTRSAMCATPASRCAAAASSAWASRAAARRADRAARQPRPYPESVPINNLVQVEGTPLAGTAPLDPFEFVRTIAVARITMPRAMVRLSAGREQMDDALQALCFAAGANSIFYGDQLLTTATRSRARPGAARRLGLRPRA